MPISVRWVDINKGDADNPNYRSMLVAREINTHKRGDLSAATPPLEALKIILSMTTTSNKGELIMINDVGRAFFHARAKRQVYVQFADEDNEVEQGKLCGRLNNSMFGTRGAAQNGFDECSQQLLSIGFTQGAAAPCISYNHEKDIRTFVHGDGYVSIGKLEGLNWLREPLAKKYQIKTQTLGLGRDQMKEAKVLNKIVTWDQVNGITYEADSRHVKIKLDQLNLQDAKPAAIPGTSEEGRTPTFHQPPLEDTHTHQRTEHWWRASIIWRPIGPLSHIQLRNWPREWLPPLEEIGAG